MALHLAGLRRLFLPLLVVCFFVPDLWAVTTLNMSHDLVALGIAGQNMTPNNPALDARPLFSASIQYARTQGVTLITADSGAYYFLTSENSNYYLYLGSLTNLTIDLAGSTIYFKEAFLYGIGVSQSNGVTLKNFETDFLNPPYTHAQLTAIDANQRTLSYATLSGWSDPTTFNTFNPAFGQPQLYVVPFRNGALVGPRMAVSRPISQGVLTLTQDNAPWTQADTLPSTLQAGDVLVLIARGGGVPVQVYRSDNVTVSGVEVHGASAVGVLMDTVSNSTVDQVRITPRPNTGLIAANADGIMFNLAQQNNHLRNSYVTRTLDDAMSLNSIGPGTVVSQNGPRTVTVQRAAYNRFPNGTLLNFVDRSSGAEISGATIVSQQPPDSDNPSFGGQVVLTVSQDLPSLPQSTSVAYGSPEMRGSGSTIEDNVVEDIPYGRGIYIGGNVNVIVRRNLVRQMRCDGIVVAQTTQNFPGPPAHDVTIRDNRLLNILGPGCETNKTLAAISVNTRVLGFGFGTSAVNTNVSVINNFIAESGHSGISIGQLNGGQVANNFVSRWYTQPTIPLWRLSGDDDSDQILADFQLPIVVRSSSGIVNQNNQTNSGATPAISLTSLTPASITAGTSAITLTLNGNFIPGAAALFGGVQLQTDYVSNQQLNALIPQAEIATAGARVVTVANPDPLATSSGSSLFQVYSQKRRSQVTSVAWKQFQ